MSERTTRLGLAGATAALAAATVTAWAWSPDTPAASGPGPGPGLGAVAFEGAALFHAKGCASCHHGPDSTAPVAVGPSLAGLGAVAGSREPGVSAADYVRRSITSPDSYTVPGFAAEGMGSMPTLAVSGAEVEALVAYLLGPGS